MNALKKDELRLVRSWVKETGYEFVKLENNIYAIPAQLVDGINFLYPKLDVIYFGVFVGEIKAGRLIPSHALAMSNLVSENPERIELNKEQAIDFLKKKELKGIAANKGWKMVLYKNHPLGWINILSGRINNYYPKQLRILKDI